MQPFFLDRHHNKYCNELYTIPDYQLHCFVYFHPYG
nr:MAG TPA: hypothetical protein [Caudoviricetes sp.]